MKRPSPSPHEETSTAASGGVEEATRYSYLWDAASILDGDERSRVNRPRAPAKVVTTSGGSP
jgi:hypothetical protein